MAKRNRRTDLHRVDFGISSANEFWKQLILPLYREFQTKPTGANAIVLSLLAWHMHEWLWYDSHPDVSTKGNPEYKIFKDRLFTDCPQIKWINDIADASKHRDLGRTTPTPEVDRVKTGEVLIGATGTRPTGTLAVGAAKIENTPLAVTLTNGKIYKFCDVICAVISYFESHYFPEAPQIP